MQNWAEELKRIREERNKSQSDMAKIVGIPQRSWSNYEAGRTEPPVKVLIALAQNGYKIKGLPSSVENDLVEELGISREKIIQSIKLLKRLNLHPDMPVEEAGRIVRIVQKAESGLPALPIISPSEVPDGAFVVPLLDQRLSAGPGADLPESDAAAALVQVPAYLAQYGKHIAALTVDGDSMAPTLRRGDMVVCDSMGWSGEGIYAVRMGGSGFVKRITKAPGKIVIISDNPKYPPREEPEESTDFAIIGRVHCAITKVE